MSKPRLPSPSRQHAFRRLRAALPPSGIVPSPRVSGNSVYLGQINGTQSLPTPMSPSTPPFLAQSPRKLVVPDPETSLTPLSQRRRHRSAQHLRRHAARTRKNHRPSLRIHTRSPDPLQHRCPLFLAHPSPNPPPPFASRLRYRDAKPPRSAP